MNIPKPPHWLSYITLPIYSLPAPVPSFFWEKTKCASSRTAATITKDEEIGLKWLRRDDQIWARLWEYVTPRPFSDDITLQAPVFRTWDCPNAPVEAPSDVDATEYRIHTLTAAYKQLPGDALQNNASARDNAAMQIFSVLNLYLQIRYPNALVGNTNEKIRFATPDGESLTADQAASDGIFYPRWGNVIGDNLITEITDVDEGDIDGGYPSKVLELEPSSVRGQTSEEAGRTNFAFSESMTPWDCPTDVLVSVANGANNPLESNDAYPEDGFARQLLQKLWGNSYLLGTNIGFVTNHDGVIAILKDTTPGRSGFVLSSVLPWTDNRLLTCLIGLSFIAIDAQHWVNETVISMLAPGPADAIGAN